MKKRIVSLLLVICMITAVLPLNAMAAGTGTIDNPWKSNAVNVYRDGKTLHVYGSGAMADYDKASAAPWYSISGQIDSIVVETNVTYLGRNAFASCGSVTNVRIKRDMAISGGAIGMGDTALPVNIDVALELSGNDYMADYDSNQPWANLKTRIVSVNVAEGVKSIGKQAFSGCINLTEVVIPGSVEYIGQEAFANCISLKDVTLRHDFGANAASGTVFTIGTNAFPVSNSGFKIGMEITGTTAVPDYADPANQPWANLRDYIKTLTIGGNVAGIGNNAFSGCTKLTNVTMYFYENGGVATKALGTDWFREHDTNAVINVVGVSTDKAFTCWENATFADAANANTIYFYNRDPLTIKANWTGVAYGITVKPTDNKDYGRVSPGYEALEPYVVTVKNTGNKASGQLHVELSGGYASSFTLSKKYIGSLPVRGTDTFSVVPNTALAIGDYTTAVVVSDENGTIATFRVSLAVSTPESRASEFVKRLYLHVLGRNEDKIDEEGFAKWVGALAGGTSVAQVASGFYAGEEFRSRGVSDTDFVDSLYRTLLNRAPDAGGRQIWLDCLNAGKSRAWVFEQFCESAEFKNLCAFYELVPGTIDAAKVDMSNKVTIGGPAKAFVERLYNIVLGRAPDTAGLNDWTTQLMTKKSSGAVVAAGFFGSVEYVSQKKSNRDFIIDLYATMLDRTYDQAGLDHWLGHLASGKTRSWVYSQFCISQEFKNICAAHGLVSGSIDPKNYNMGSGDVTQSVKVDPAVAESYVRNLYTQFLGREADEEGLKLWKEQLVNGNATAATVAASIAGSAECVNRNLGNEDYVKTLYRALMGKEGDAAGIASWTASLNGGTKRSVIFKAFVDSAEFKAICNGKGLSAGTIDAGAYSMG